MKIVTRKRIILTILLLFVGYIILMIFSYFQDFRRFIGAAGFLVVMYCTLTIPRLIMIRYFQFKKPGMAIVMMLLLVIFIDAIVIISWFKYQENQLHNHGLNTKAIVFDRKGVSDRSGGGYKITYRFYYNSEWNCRFEKNNEYVGNLGFDPTKEFHDYRFEYDENLVSFYIDGIFIKSWSDGFPKEGMYLMINSWYPTWLDGVIPKETQTLRVDWVRY